MQRAACSQPPEGTRQRPHLWDLYQGWKQSTTEKQSEPAVRGGCCTTSQSSLALCVPYATLRQMAVVFPETFQTFFCETQTPRTVTALGEFADEDTAQPLVADYFQQHLVCQLAAVPEVRPPADAPRGHPITTTFPSCLWASSHSPWGSCSSGHFASCKDRLRKSSHPPRVYPQKCWLEAANP